MGQCVSDDDVGENIWIRIGAGHWHVTDLSFRNFPYGSVAPILRVSYGWRVFLRDTAPERSEAAEVNSELTRVVYDSATKVQSRQVHPGIL